MPHRDPSTGKFVSTPAFEDTETVPFEVSLMFRGNTSGGSITDWKDITEFEGVEIVDLDQLLDRHRIATLVHIDAALHVNAFHFATAINEAAVSVEISASPSRQAAYFADTADYEDIADFNVIDGDMDELEVYVEQNDTVDLPMRPLTAGTSAPFADDTDQHGGGGQDGIDRAQGPTPGDWDFDRRDELYVNGVVGSSSGFAGSIQAFLSGIMTFSVVED